MHEQSLDHRATSTCCSEQGVGNATPAMPWCRTGTLLKLYKNSCWLMKVHVRETKQISNEKTSNNLRKKRKRRIKSRVWVWRRSVLDASLSVSPCPLWLHNPEPFQTFRLLIPLTILQRPQDLRELPVPSQTLAFFSFSRRLNPALTKWRLPRVPQPCLLRDIKDTLLKVFWSSHPPSDP